MENFYGYLSFMPNCTIFINGIREKFLVYKKGAMKDKIKAIEKITELPENFSKLEINNSQFNNYFEIYTDNQQEASKFFDEYTCNNLVMYYQENILPINGFLIVIDSNCLSLFYNYVKYKDLFEFSICYSLNKLKELFELFANSIDYSVKIIDILDLKRLNPNNNLLSEKTETLDNNEEKQQEI